MAPNQHEINQEYLSELKSVEIKLPNFKKMGIEKLCDYIYLNDKNMHHNHANFRAEMPRERTMEELEIWATEIYLRLYKSLNLLVISSPSVTICIKAKEEVA